MRKCEKFEILQSEGHGLAPTFSPKNKSCLCDLGDDLGSGSVDHSLGLEFANTFNQGHVPQ